MAQLSRSQNGLLYSVTLKGTKRAVNLKGCCASVNPRFKLKLKGGFPDLLDRIPDFVGKLNAF